ncbi:MAG: ribbon-helix-helix domain-containing protein [Planctomycetota bacterium]
MVHQAAPVTPQSFKSLEGSRRRVTSASEVVREALRLLDESDRLRSMRVHELRQHIAQGLTSAKAGKLKDGEAVVSRLRDRIKKGRRDQPKR